MKLSTMVDNAIIGEELTLDNVDENAAEIATLTSFGNPEKPVEEEVTSVEEMDDATKEAIAYAKEFAGI